MDKQWISMIEEQLYSFLPGEDCREKKLIESMKYSLEAGGKRVRPLLVMAFNTVCGGNPEAALPFAAAVEMIHTYSLIHDDLPCMDNDDLRRGKPSNHKVFGEDTALLAGDALLTLAFEALTCDRAVIFAGNASCRRAVQLLAKYAGVSGMVGGQVIDIMSENTQVDLETIREMDYKKTACLIKAACELGCVSASAEKAQVLAASRYGECIGIAFQIQDDILDCTSTDEELGKPVGSDEENKKSTYVSLLGIDKAREMVKTLTDSAIASLSLFEGDTSSLAEFARSLSVRTK